MYKYVYILTNMNLKELGSVYNIKCCHDTVIITRGTCWRVTELIVEQDDHDHYITVSTRFSVLRCILIGLCVGFECVLVIIRCMLSLKEMVLWL